uniref:[histone H3]-lysine(4) N-methyltransferase n=1 Tax=Knipowitschia caucasica TaxID=637954 RepID=A0AAV2IYU3_KNICA
MKLAEPTKVLGQESDSSETSVRGPRIKHVCRRAAVALGRNRAVFPDDMPTLSALPWEEREKILSSMGNDDKSSVAGSEEAEPQSPPIKPRETRHKPIQDAPPKKGRRSRRCGQCSGCQVPEDCGECTNCLDKPKFGGRNIKKQCCKMRKCQNLQWMPSKILLKQGKGKKEKRRNKVSEKKDSANTVKESNAESTMKPTPSSPKEESLDSSEPSAVSEVKQLTSVSTQSSPVKTSVLHLAQQKNWPTVNQTLSKKESPKSDPRKSLQESPILPSSITPDSDLKRTKSSISWPDLSKQRPKDKALTTKPHHSSNLNWLSTPSTRGPAKSRATCDGVHRIRVDLKRDHDVDKVWDVGGLSLLTSGPVTPRVLCLLCASSGNVEFVYCQVCCEPFHLFCLGESERPHQEQFENWCCRRCRFCQACGRKHHKNKQPLLECDKCRNSYHPECLGTNYPSRPTKKKKIWVCSNCVCCKSCGATKPGKSWNAQWSHDFSMCQECAKVSFKGKLCLLCNKCYDEDDDCGRRMMQCGHCKFWVHAKCEKLTDEMYELLPNLPESVAFTCTKCTDCCPSLWRTELERNLQSCIRTVLNALLNSHTSMHLLRFRQQSVKPPELNPETEERQPSRRSPEGPDPPVLMEATSEPSDSPQDLESVEKKMDLGCYKSVMEFGDDIARIIQTSIHSSGGQLESRKANGMVKAFFIRQMDRIFPWIKVKESRFWERQKVSASVLLPNAVLPPSLDHNYAQWQERQELSRAVQPLFTKKIIPAPSPQSQSGPDPASSPSVHPSLIRPLPLSPGDEDSPDSPVPPGIGDNRQCALCLKYGDENNNEGGRLLYIGQNEWTHINCALWSSDVFEDDNGSLKNVHLAVLRGKEMSCEKCQRPGATVSCCLTSCSNNYHFMCARQCQCIFLEDKKVYCSKHRDLIKGHAVSGFAVTRRVLVDIESMSLKKKWLSGLEPDDIHMIIGSMTIDCLGKLTELSDCKRKLFPVGYQCSRVYWSTIDARKRCVYTCRILVCHSAVSECDLRSTMAPEHNLTIAHSPSPVADFPDPFESPRRSDTLSPSCAPKLRVYTRNRHPSYPPAGPRPLISSGGTSQIQSHPVVTAGHSLPNPSGGGREIHFSSPSANSDSSESDTQPHAAEVSLPRGYSQGLLAEDDPEGQDDDHQSLDDKHHDDDSDGSGSAKRRYPRRSARARSNMFFGLTPFYGVRSYGEEDLHFYGSEEVAGSMVKKRSGVRKKSAEGQVDGADDISSSSSSGDSGEDDGSHNPYYYNFTRTIINPGEGLPSIEGIDQCLGQESQLQRFLKDEEQQKRQADTEEDLLSELSLGQQHIGQLDGVDDGSESDTSISTTSTTNTIATSTPPKNTPKRRTRERHSDKMDSHPSNKDSDNSGGPGGGNTREGRKHQKENCLPHVGKSQAQSQDPLDAQLSLSTDLLKSDSDNNNSDDCGNILPSDIMEFVLNTPSLSMQTLGQQAESSSSELLLDEGFVGVDVNRRKDILFDDFSQPLSSSESGSGSGVESNVNNSMSVEEPYLPLELPSDLSVLTTRSPTVSASQNHTAGSLIADPSDRSMLNLTTDSETIRGRKISHKKREENQHNTTSLGNQDVTEGHMTPEQFIPSPAIGQAVETTVNPDVPRAAGTPSLPSSPSISLKGGGPINVPVQTSIASSLCVLPSHQSISMSKGETEGGTVQYNKTQTLESGQNASSRTTPISRSYELKQSHPCTIAPATGGEKGKTKAKRSLQNPEVVGGKKHKAYQEHYNRPSATPSVKANSSSKVSCSSEPMDTGKPTDKSTNHGKKKTSECPGKIVGKGKVSHAKRAGSLIVSSAPGQEDNAKDSALDSKPKKGIIFEISSEDGFHIRCESIEEAWKSLTDKVQEARFHAHLKELSFDGVNALRMLGIVHEAVVFLLEQLSGSRHCRSYRFRFHKPEESDEPPVNPHGSARAEIHNRRSVFDVFNFLASKHRQPPAYRPQDEEEEEGQLRVARRAFMELPLTVRFKQIKTTCKETVGVYRSPIHGRGLFCKKTIDAGEMVIEYSGNVIRSVLTDKREKYYDGKGIGCYMFRIDDFEVVDATVHGNAARFINHSCEPNCYSRVITVDGQKHIVIFALRRIYCGEELTYDYKFPIEDASSKLPCNCGAKKCRSFLN